MTAPSRTVVVAGAGGWIGRTLRDIASRSPAFADWSILALSRHRRVSELLAEVADSGSAITIVNLAGRRQGTRLDLQASNADYAAQLASEASSLGVPFLQIGSAAEYGPSSGSPLSEQAACRPVSEYGRSKLEGTQAVFSHLDPRSVTVARPFNVLGCSPPEQSIQADIQWRLKEAAAKGHPPRLEQPDVVRDFLPVQEVAYRLLSLVPHVGTEPIVNICSGIGRSWRALVDTAAQEYSFPSCDDPSGESHDAIVGDPSLYVSLVGERPQPDLRELARLAFC